MLIITSLHCRFIYMKLLPLKWAVFILFYTSCKKCGITQHSVVTLLTNYLDYYVSTVSKQIEFSLVPFLDSSSIQSKKFGGYFSEEFSSNQLQTLAQWSLGIGEVCYIFIRIPSCSSGFIQNLLDHYADQCQILMGYFSLSFYPIDSNLGTGIEVLCYDFFKNSQLFFQIYSGFCGSLWGSMSAQCTWWSPIHLILDQSISTFCYKWLHTDTLWVPHHITIKIHLMHHQ